MPGAEAGPKSSVYPEGITIWFGRFFPENWKGEEVDEAWKALRAGEAGVVIGCAV